MSEATRGPRNVQENKQKNNLHCTANGRPTEDKEKNKQFEKVTTVSAAIIL